MAALGRQTNLAVNTNKSQVYFEDVSNPLSYNWMTDQWTRIPDYGGIGFYNVASGLNIGLVRTKTGVDPTPIAIDLQQPDSSDPAAQATITTGESTFSDGSRRIITGVRPLLTANDANVSIFTRDTLNPSTRTNYLLYSEDLSDSAWTKANGTVSVNDVTAPDGILSADTFTGDDGGAVRLTQTSQNIGASGGDFIASAYLRWKDQAFPHIKLRVTDSGDYVLFNILGGFVTLTSLSAGELVAYGIEAASNSFFRCWVKYTSVATSTPTIEITQTTSLGTALPTTEGTYIWGAMIEPVSSLGSYIKSEGTVGTKTLDQTTESTINSRSGIAPFRAESRYHRVQLRVSGGFTTILGADVEFEHTGEI